MRLFNGENAFVLDMNGKLYSNKSGSSVTENPNDGLSIYPNPVNGTLHLFIPNDLDFQQAELFDMHGQSLLISNETEIDLSNYAKGIYLLNVEPKPEFTGEE